MGTLLKKEMALFCKNKLFLLLVIIAFGHINYQTIQFLIMLWVPATPALFMVARMTHGFASLVFGLVLVISFLWFWSAKQSDLFEIVASNPKWTMKFLLVRAVGPAILLTLFTINVAIYDMVWYVRTNANFLPFLWQLMQAWVLHFWLPGLFAILLSLLATLASKSKQLGYMWVFGGVFLFTPLFAAILKPMSYLVPSVYRIVDLFGIYPQNLLEDQNCAYGLTVEPWRWVLILFWIGIAALGIYKKIKPRQTAKSHITTVVGIFALGLTLGWLCLPNGMVRTPSRLYLNPNNFVQDDISYFTAHTKDLMPDEAADFEIEYFGLDLKITDQLSATASILIGQSSDTLKFTLYHGYKVKSVTDENGNKLDFERDTDYLTIYNAKNLKQVKITYQGYSTYFYSNRQAVYLPSGFAYYPVPGYQTVFSNSGGLQIMRVSQNIPLEVKISANQTVYTNFAMVDGVYKGVCNDLTLIAGLVKKNEIDGIAHIYSPVADRKGMLTTAQINTKLRAMAKYYKVDLPVDFSYTYIQIPDLAFAFRLSSPTTAHINVFEPADMVAARILLNLAKPTDTLPKKMLTEYFDYYMSSVLEYQSLPDKALDQLGREWLAFSKEHGMEQTMDGTLTYVLQNKTGGLMNFLNEFILEGKANETT